MKSRMDYPGNRQSEYLLEYDRRRILSCADTFSSLASVFLQMEEEEDREEDREARLQMFKARETQKNYAAWLRQLAGMMQDVAGSSVQLIRLGGRQESQIIHALAGEGLIVSDIYLLRGTHGKLEISISLSTRKNTTITVEEVAGYLSVLMDLRLVAQKRNPYFIGMEPVSLYFEEEPTFCFLTGAATAVRENEKISGDSYSFYEEDGRLSMILSDGVGSGERAAADSSRIVDLTEQILDAGLSGGMAVRLLDGMANAWGNETHMSTLDLCRIDLQDGSLRFAKAGAVCSFIRRKEGTERIAGDSLPLGMGVSETDGEILRQLRSGDMVIMISDGVAQDWPDPDCFETLREQIEHMESVSPVEMANRLLQYVIGRCQGKIRDDMTVLVAGIWENEAQA